MDDTRCAIRQGRVLADQGLYAHAHDAWKAALSSAYASQDYAGMFVLSGNVGEACVRLAEEEKDISRARKLLEEATEHLDYALQVVEQCSLREVMGGYRALYRGVRRVEGLSRKVEEQLQQLEEKEKRKCTTCGVKDVEMVLDENDGCVYCSKCYEEFYAVHSEETAQEEVKTLESEEGGYEDEMEEEIVAVESDPTEVEVLQAEVVVDERNEVVQDAGEVVTTDRIRYERVELGSLADFLAGKLPIDDGNENNEVLPSDALQDELLPVNAALADVRLPVEEPADPAAFDQQDIDVNRATSDGGAGVACAEEVPMLNEEEYTADAARGRLQYLVAQLLELRQLSPTECPEALLTSPVHDDGSAPSPARNKASSNGRKKANSSKKTSRSAASHRQNKPDTAGSNLAEVEEADAAPQVSLLPTLTMCAAMREALEAQPGGAAANCDSPMAAGTLDLAATATAMLSSSPSTLHPLATHVRLRSE